MLNIHKDIEHKVRSYRIYPLAEGLIAAIVICFAVGISSWFIYVRSDAALQGEIQDGLLRTTAVVSTMIDGDIHKSLTSKKQESSEEYQDLVKTLRQIKASNEDIHYIYSGILKDGQVRFVLDAEQEGDHDGDGLDDHVHIGDLYEEASDEMLTALKEQRPVVSREPYQDRWGKFVSGYAPIYDKNHNFVGVLGMDIAIAKYEARLKPIRQATIRAAATGLFISFLTGVGVWFMRRFADEINQSRQRIMKDLEEAVHIARNAAKAKSEFLANMSHEIRTPLNAILGFTRTLLGSSLTSTQKEQVETIEEAGNALISIINEILDLSKIEAGKIALHTEDFDLMRCVENVTNLLSSQAGKKGIELCTLIAPDVPTVVHGDQGRIRQIFINLIGNAIKFTNTGGVALELSLEESHNEKVMLRCLVRDTGIGIAKEHLSKVFDEFSQADKTIEKRFGGTGLGLAITQKLIHLMLGDITVDSELGKGTAFSFLIQLNRAEMQIAQRFKTGIMPYNAMILGGSPFFQDNLKKQLEEWEIQVVLENDVDKAMSTVLEYTKSKKPIEVLLIDHGVKGLPLFVQKLRSHIQCKDLKIILLRSTLEHHDIEGESQYNDVISKPIRQNLLAKVISLPAKVE